MYSPRRTATEDYDNLLRSPERSNMVASPLRAFASPFYKAVKTAQSNASRDFDKFYGNLQQKLTPRTSQARIQKQTPDTTERMRSMLLQRRAQADYDSTRTSLTPLIERHTLQEGGNYISRNPFYQESVSEVADTPSLSDHNDDTPMTFTTLGKRSPTFTIDSPSSHKRPFTGVSSTLQQKLAEERKRMDKLQSNLQKIRRQSSLLAEDLSATHLSFEQEDEYEDEEHEDEQDMFMAAAPSSKEDISRSLNVRSADERRPSSNAFSMNGRHSPIAISSSRSYKHSTTPKNTSIKPTSSSSTVTQTTATPFSSSPRRTLNHNGSNNNYSISACDRTSPPSSPNRTVPPKRTIINDISSGHLRSAETLSTPGGSRVSNRFWKEIHGLSTRRESASPSRTTGGRITKPTAPTAKRPSTLQVNSSNSWANDDGFWSSNSSPVASSLNNKLLQLAQEKDKEDKPTHIRQSFAKRLFDTNKESEVDSEEHSLFQNPLFKRAAQSEQQAHFMNEPSSSPTPASLPAQHASHTLSAEIEVANKRDEIKKRNNIPTMNANVLAELKARHKEKLIDDTDSYKFAS
ncbi:hypothetical protein MAM1_0143d06458 [Mucor ambiguus]|uniref:Uncharacterized protein n=1 Tax=Mucor ambiguus TaxID=91626 RepID=A0A0C9MXP2_9FUNG|nr:hypothetical protein MAM1_0143d06458 [Mucor ambiguus]